MRLALEMMMMMMTMVAVLGGPRHDTAAGAPHRQPRRIADVYGMDFGSWCCGRMEEKWNSGGVVCLSTYIVETTTLELVPPLQRLF